jgi:hypothetical protein
MRLLKPDVPTCFSCRTDSGAGDCWECLVFRNELFFAGRGEDPRFWRLALKLEEDRTIRERTLQETETAFLKEIC